MFIILIILPYIINLCQSLEEIIIFTEGYIIEKDKNTILIGPSFSSGYLFLWDLFKKSLNDLIILPCGINDICPWNNDYIFATLGGN